MTGTKNSNHHRITFQGVITKIIPWALMGVIGFGLIQYRESAVIELRISTLEKTSSVVLSERLSAAMIRIEENHRRISIYESARPIGHLTRREIDAMIEKLYQRIIDLERIHRPIALDHEGNDKK